MPRRAFGLRRIPVPPISLRTAALAVLTLLPLAPLALLCRGRSPSRFDRGNLPVWERRAPSPAPRRVAYALPPPPPGTIQIPGNPWIAALLKSPDPAGAKDIGVWLQAACVWGRSDRALAARQDTLATRLLATQNDAGWLGAADGDKPPTPAQWAAQRPALSGLLAWYALVRRPEAAYAALTLGDRALPRLAQAPNPAWAEPLARLYGETGDDRFLRAARRLASPADGAAQCALYEASGDPACLQAAVRAATHPDPTLAAELLLLTGQPRWATALNAAPASASGSPAAAFGAALARAAWTRAPMGMAVHTTQPCGAGFAHVRLMQTGMQTGAVDGTGAAGRTITVRVPRPTAFKLRVFLPPGPPTCALVNGRPQTASAPPGGYVLLVRRWRNGDRVTFGPAPVKPKAVLKSPFPY